MKVLVTGGAGYVGSHTCKALARAGHEPVVYDNLSTGHRWAVKWGPCVVADIADPATLEAALRDHRIDAVIHFAGSCYVEESIRDPMKYFRNNVLGSEVLLESMMRCGVEKIIFSSSCAVYGVPDAVPIAEDHPTRPINPYGESKLVVEKMLRWLGETKGLRWIALRYFNAAGADADGEIGESHEPETHLIPLAIKAAAGGDYRLSIFGTDHPTPDGTAIRDYVHVSDLATAHLLALQSLDLNSANGAVNLGAGNGTSVREVIKLVEKITGAKVRYTDADRRTGDPPELVADIAKVQSFLNWTPPRSSLSAIVEDAWRWHRSRHRGD